MLDAAGATGSVPGLASPFGSTNGSRALAAAQTQIGQAEQPPGSNDGPAIAMYRSAVEGSYAGRSVVRLLRELVRRPGRNADR